MSTSTAAPLVCEYCRRSIEPSEASRLLVPSPGPRSGEPVTGFDAAAPMKTAYRVHEACADAMRQQLEAIYQGRARFS